MKPRLSVLAMETYIFKMAAKDTEEKVKMKPTMEMKRRAVKYYNENKVPKCLEDLLNTMFLEEPEDIYGYMAEYFGKMSKAPTITKVLYKDTISCRGYNTFNASIFCKINGLEKQVLNLAPLFDDGPKVETQRVKSKPTTGSKTKSDKKLAAAHISAAVNHAEAFLPKPLPFDYEQTKDDIILVSEQLADNVLPKQKEIDVLIRSALREVGEARTKLEPKDDSTEPQPENPEKLCIDCLRKTKVDYSELYLSLLTAKLSSELNSCPFYRSLCMEFMENDADEISLPSAMLLVMKCGTENLGKLNLFRGVYLVPKLQTSFLEGFQTISSVYRELGNILHQKLGINGRLVNKDGSYSPALERPDQVFEFLQNAFAAVNMEMESHVDIILDIGAAYFYDEEKKKYEISTGNFRTSDDLLLMYSDFIEKYPVIGIIDGMSHKDLDCYSALNKQLSGKCFCLGDSLFLENIDKIEDNIENQTCGGAVVRLGHYFSNLTELEKLSTLIKETRCGFIMPTTTAQGCTSKVVADLATAFRATFVALGAPLHNENTDVCDRLVQIETELKMGNKLKQRDSYHFPEYREETEDAQGDEKDGIHPSEDKK